MPSPGVIKAVNKEANKLTLWLSIKGYPLIYCTSFPGCSTTQPFSLSKPEKEIKQSRVKPRKIKNKRRHNKKVNVCY